MQRSLKVAIIGSRGAHSSYGGIEKVLSQICPRLAAAGHNVHVFCDKSDDVSASSVPGVTSIRVPAFSGKYTETVSRSLLATCRAIAGNYDVINLLAIGPGILSFLPRLVGVPVVVSIHGLDWQRDKWPAPARAALKVAERMIVSRANAITVVSRQLQTYFRDTYARETICIPNGINTITEPVNNDHLTSMGLEPDGYVAFASRLVPEKGAHELIAAFNKVATDKKLVIAGGGRYDQPYVDRLKSLDTTGRIVFTGHLTGASLHSIFRGAYLYVLPSHMEGLSMSLLEAMAFGKATLVSDIPENVEVVQDCGFLFPVGDVDALAVSLSRLLHAPDEVEEMGRRARGRAQQLYSWNSVAGQYSDVYRRIAECQSPSPTESNAKDVLPY